MMEFSSKISTRWLVNQPRYSDPLVSVVAEQMHLQIYKALVTIERAEQEKLQAVTKQYLQQQQQQQQYNQKQRQRQLQLANRLENLQTTVVGGNLS